jgi:phage/plasmid-like protein (TIGR03299 family)
LIQEELTLPQDRPKAEILAGHDYEVVEVPNGNIGRVIDPETYTGNIARVNGEWRSLDVRAEKKALYVKQQRPEGPGPLHGNFLEVANDSYEVIPNSIGWDLMEALFDEGLKLDTGFVLKGGAICVITAFLPEAVYLPGDSSRIFPFVSASWGHDGSRGLNVRSTNVREVCWNTFSASELVANAAGTQFTFRHTKNWRERVAEAKKVISGLAEQNEAYVEVLQEFASTPVDSGTKQRFALAVALDQRAKSTLRFKEDVAKGVYSPKVQRNAESAAEKVLALFNTASIPEAHKDTAYGLFLAGGEYLDHVRKYQSDDSYVGRTLLRDEPAKARLPKLIRDLVEVA